VIRCGLCDATLTVAAGRAPQESGWSQLAVNAPRGNRYLTACPAHTAGDLTAWLKTALAAVLKGKA
jgi:hypothetical protein